MPESEEFDESSIDFASLDKELNWDKAREVDNPVIVSHMLIGSAQMVWEAHDCENPEHDKERSSGVLCLIFVDVEGVEHPIFIHPDSKLLLDLCDMDVYYSIKHVAENHLGLDL